MPSLRTLSRLDVRDRRMVEQAEEMLGPEPESMGFVKNLYWGRIRWDHLAPYRPVDPDEEDRCRALLDRLDTYLWNEHPAEQIDREERIPEWVIERLFELGVLGCTIPEEYGGEGLGMRSYCRVLEHIGRRCGSTAVLVSAHQSIGCKAIIEFGTPEQKERWLPRMAREELGAFCLSEPGVGSDAGSIETTCRLSGDGTHYVLNGEKKWATSGAWSGLFTVVARLDSPADRSGGTAALVCTPEMEGIDVYEPNRSKCGIRGTWQARIRFRDVRVPRDHLLHEEGEGLRVALRCLNYGRCTLSAGVLGAAKQASEQAIKWVRARRQFDRPLIAFERVRERVAEMRALVTGAESMLYTTAGMLDRGEEDVMVETASAKVFASARCWTVIDHAMQLMGGEGYMHENELERIWRDHRIHRIVEGSNDVMRSFIFAYGSKQLVEEMLALREGLSWDESEPTLRNVRRIGGHLTDRRLLGRGLSIGRSWLGWGSARSVEAPPVGEGLEPEAERFARLVGRFHGAVQRAALREREDLVSRQSVQAPLADASMLLFALGCVLARMDTDEPVGTPHGGDGWIGASENRLEEREVAASARYFLDWAEARFEEYLHRSDGAPNSMEEAVEAASARIEGLPDEPFHLPELYEEG